MTEWVKGLHYENFKIALTLVYNLKIEEEKK